MVVLLGNRFFAVAIRCGAAMEESVYYSAGVKQVGDETEMRCSVRTAGEPGVEESRSVHSVGMRERLPSGKIRIRCGLP